MTRMKPSYINGLLLGGLLLFVIGYWALKSQNAPATQETTVPQSAPIVSQPVNGEGPALHENIDILKERVAHTPNDTTLLNHVAQLLHDAGRYEEAADYYNQYLERAPQSVQGWLDLANVYAALNDWDGALRASESLLAFRPENPSAMYNMGAILANTARKDEAHQWWTRVAEQEQDPDLALQASLSLQQLGGAP